MTIVHELWRGDKMIAYLNARPSYCDRGRWVQGIEVGIHRSDADSAPRYYFDLEASKNETLAYLRAKGVDFVGALWREVRYEGDATIDVKEVVKPDYVLRKRPAELDEVVVLETQKEHAEHLIRAIVQDACPIIRHVRFLHELLDRAQNEPPRGESDRTINPREFANLREVENATAQLRRILPVVWAPDKDEGEKDSDDIFSLTMGLTGVEKKNKE